jgi:hypothetical protein
MGKLGDILSHPDELLPLVRAALHRCRTAPDRAQAAP